MLAYYPYLKNSSFLNNFVQEKNQEQFVKITVLDFYERPIQSIEGRVTGGTFNLDGKSSIRRTCNINLVLEEGAFNIFNVSGLLSINKKIRIEIGFNNFTQDYLNYNIIWFPMGTYVIINPSIGHNTSGITISLQLKDKMCLLNGECGGTIPSSVTFSEYETIDENGQYVILKPTIVQIITELVNHFGGEQLGKIIISDIDNRIKKVMKWTGSTPLYIIQKIGSNTIQYIPTTNESVAVESGNYTIYKAGEDIGYIYTDFVYPDELIADAGNSVCDILDKIKDLLGNYEYFYDLDGNFIFQEIKNYLNNSKAKYEIDKIENNDYLIDMSNGKSVYSFEDGKLFTSYSNTPQFNMIKNDFIVWGMRENANGNTLPIRFHLAIDTKPKPGNKYEVFFYEDPEDKILKAKCPMHFPTKNDFPVTGVQGVFYMADDTKLIFSWDSKEKVYINIAINLETITTTDWRSELYLSGVSSEPYGTDSNYYYTELLNEWTKIYDLKNGKFYDESIKYPGDMDYFLDFIDSSAAISEFSIQNIGRRTKTITDDNVNCLFEPEIPDLILLNIGDKDIANLRAECEAKGQNYIQMEESMFNLITGGGNFNSAYNMIKDLLYEYTSYNESISINSIPFYFLEPNTRITVRDNNSGIYGDYMINSISIGLGISGTMTLSCSRALERL